MPNTVAGYGRGGGTPAAPIGSNNNEKGLHSLVPGNTRPVSLRPGMVLVGTVNAYSGAAPGGAITQGGSRGNNLSGGGTSTPPYPI